ncbi:MAG: TlpA disulfide reductase family protein [Nitrospinaceae bacterium]
MKSIVSKKRNFTLTKKYIGLYLVLFVGAILFFFAHLNENPFSIADVKGGNKFDREQPSVGYLAPGFVLKNLEGKRVRLDSFRGRVVLLNFWATWCAPCRLEMPSFEHLYRRYRSRGLTVLAVSLDKAADARVRSFAEDYGLSFPVLLDPESRAERLYPSPSIPFTFVIDQSGRVVARVDGAKNWESKDTFEAIEYLLNIT